MAVLRRTYFGRNVTSPRTTRSNFNFGRLNLRQYSLNLYSNLIQILEDDDVLPILWYLNEHHGNINNFLNHQPQLVQNKFMELIYIINTILNDQIVTGMLRNIQPEFNIAYHGYINEGNLTNTKFIFYLFNELY